MTATAGLAGSPPPPLERGEPPLRRAAGVELLGEFEDSGFREPPLLARRADGQVVQLSRMLYVAAEACDGRRGPTEVAAAVSARTGRGVSAGNVRYLAERKLRPLGVLALADGTTPALPKRAALFALRHRKRILSERATNALARPLTWLHRPAVAVLLLGCLAALDVWLFGIHGIAGPLRSAIYSPVLLLAVLGSIVVATAFHEFGHASACRYGGARPGVVGVGLYLVWPAFYCDVTDAYRLNRRGRLRTDLGGIYFNGIFALGAAGVYFTTGEEAALLAVVVQHMIALQQLLPLLRFDGYYVLSDLTGLPDILSRIKPIFRSLVPGRRREPRVAELKPWVRVVTTVYLLVLVPLLVFMMAWFVISVPRLVATIHDSVGLQVDRIRAAAGVAEVTLGGIRIAALTLPVAAMSLSMFRTARLAGRGVRGWARGSAVRSALAAAGVAALLGGIGYTWWPNGDYAPIRPGERGTIGGAIGSVPKLPGGRPSFTPEREEDLGGAPTVREVEADERTTRERSRVDPAATPAPPDGDTPSEGPDTPDRDRAMPPEDDLPVTVEDGADSTPEDPTPTPTPTPVPTAPSPAPMTTPAPTATPTVTPTPSATPSATPSPTVGPDTVTPTPTPTPTPESTASAVPETSIPVPTATATP